MVGLGLKAVSILLFLWGGGDAAGGWCLEGLGVLGVEGLGIRAWG